MDVRTKKELETLNEEKESINESLQTDKILFRMKLETGFGKEIMEELSNPKKKSIIVGIKNRYRHWVTVKREKAKRKKFLKEIRRNGRKLDGMI